MAGPSRNGAGAFMACGMVPWPPLGSGVRSADYGFREVPQAGFATLPGEASVGAMWHNVALAQKHRTGSGQPRAALASSR